MPATISFLSPVRRTGYAPLLLLLAVFLSACGQRETRVTVESVMEETRPDQESWSPKLFISQEGHPRIHMRAAYMARYETPDSTYMVLGAGDGEGDRVRVDLFDESGDSSAVVFADRITYFERERRFVARGAVRAHTPDNKHLYSEHLSWSETDRRIRTPGFARIEMPDRTLSGYGLTADEDLENYSIARVSGAIELDE
jgi:LPS export ABC transporter protein LptC